MTSIVVMGRCSICGKNYTNINEEEFQEKCYSSGRFMICKSCMEELRYQL